MSRAASITSPACRPEADISFFTRTLLAAYFIEAGLILIVAPWSGFWGRNVFVEYVPALQPVLASPYVRGAVSGIGAVTVLAGLAELGGLLVRRRQPEVPRPESGERVP
jgi:hypothetical protein